MACFGDLHFLISNILYIITDILATSDDFFLCSVTAYKEIVLKKV